MLREPEQRVKRSSTGVKKEKRKEEEQGYSVSRFQRRTDTRERYRKRTRAGDDRRDKARAKTGTREAWERGRREEGQGGKEGPVEVATNGTA